MQEYDTTTTHQPPSSPSDISQLRDFAERLRSLNLGLQGPSFFRTPTDPELAELRLVVENAADVATDFAAEMINGFLRVANESELADLCHVIRGDLEDCVSRIQSQAKKLTLWELGVAAMDLHSRMIRGLAALERSLCDSEGIEPGIQHVPDIETALATRRAYFKFWNALPAGEPQTDDEIRQRLRSAGNGIARLVGLEVYNALRAMDRRLFIKFHRRIQEWLKTDGESEPGLALWHDISAFAGLLRQINYRAELQEHDAAMLPELQSELAALDPNSRPLASDTYIAKKFELLLGRDVVLDRLIQQPNWASCLDLLQALGHTEMGLLTGVFDSQT